MNTKFQILVAWICLFAYQQTADDFWRFCLILSCVMAACTYFYRSENKPAKSGQDKNKK